MFGLFWIWSFGVQCTFSLSLTYNEFFFVDLLLSITLSLEFPKLTSLAYWGFQFVGLLVPEIGFESPNFFHLLIALLTKVGTKPMLVSALPLKLRLYLGTKRVHFWYLLFCIICNVVFVKLAKEWMWCTSSYGIYKFLFDLSRFWNTILNTENISNVKCASNYYQFYKAH